MPVWLQVHGRESPESLRDVRGFSVKVPACLLGPFLSLKQGLV